MDGALYLSLDQGGHSSRALVFDHHGQELVRARVTVDSYRPGPERLEHDPVQLVDSLRAAASEAIDRLGSRATEIVSAGLATQRSSIVCWDRRSGTALTPVISWQDRRAHQWVEHLSGHAGEIHRRTGLFLTAYYGASKLRWCLDNVPAVAQARDDDRLAFGPLASYLIYKLLEERPSLVDPANAARTLLWNPASLDWDPVLLEFFGIPRAPLPDTVPSRHAFGHLRINEQRIPLTLLMGDQPAALFAHGEPDPGRVYINVGTGAFVQRVLDHDPGRPAELLSGIAASDGGRHSWVLEGTVNGAASALTAVEQELGLDVEEVKRILPEWIDRYRDPPLFLNGVSGLGSPFWTPDFVSRFVGEGSAAEKIVAVTESIVFLIMVNVESMQRHAGSADCIVLSGGLAALDGLCHKLVELSGMELLRPGEREATARGVAFLLAGRPGHWPPSSKMERFKPDRNPGLQQRYRDWNRAMHEALAR